MTDLFTPLSNRINLFIDRAEAAGLRVRSLKLSLRELAILRGEVNEQVRAGSYYSAAPIVDLRLKSKDVWIS